MRANECSERLSVTRNAPFLLPSVCASVCLLVGMSIYLSSVYIPVRQFVNQFLVRLSVVNNLLTLSLLPVFSIVCLSVCVCLPVYVAYVPMSAVCLSFRLGICLLFLAVTGDSDNNVFLYFCVTVSMVSACLRQ